MTTQFTRGTRSFRAHIHFILVRYQVSDIIAVKHESTSRPSALRESYILQNGFAVFFKGGLRRSIIMESYSCRIIGLRGCSKPQSLFKIRWQLSGKGSCPSFHGRDTFYCPCLKQVLSLNSLYTDLLGF